MKDSLLDQETILEIFGKAKNGLFMDFDGTLSRINSIPSQAVISTATPQHINQLTKLIQVVSLISGRSVWDLRDRAPLENVIYIGNHGVEVFDSGTLHVAPDSDKYVASVTDLFRRLENSLKIPGIYWSYKTYSASIHYRATDRPEDVRERLQNLLADRPIPNDLQVFWGKQVLEIRAMTNINKGDAIANIISDKDLQSALFIGDDMTDLDAMNMINKLNKTCSFKGFNVVVTDVETPKSLIEASHYSLEGVSGVEQFIKLLAETLI